MAHCRPCMNWDAQLPCAWWCAVCITHTHSMRTMPSCPVPAVLTCLPYLPRSWPPAQARGQLKPGR